MAQGLPVSDLVNVQVIIAPKAAGFRNFGSLMILGSSSVIDLNEKRRTYTTYEQVIADFGSTSPEGLAANLFFSQSPKPNFLYVARWAQTATAGLLRGGVLTPGQQLLSNFTAVTAGALTLTIDGTSVAITGLDLSAQTNLNGVAQALQTKISAVKAGSTVTWDANAGRFTLTSGTTGTASVITYPTAPGSGTNVAGLYGFASGTALPPVPGALAEPFITAVARVGDTYPDWYGLMAATATPPSTSDHLAAAAYVEASNASRIYGATIPTTAVLDPAVTNDLASQVMMLGYKRTFTQYSSSSQYAVASTFGRAFTVDFSGNNTVITLKFKQEPGLIAEYLTETQAQALKGKNCNVFVAYNNATAILQEGVMANGYFFDEVHGLDWLQNNVQTRIFNLLYQSTTKVPQTDDGMNQIVNEINAACIAGTNNGLIAPGQWNADGFGAIARGDTLKLGFYTYCPPVATQAQADREKRVTPLMQTAVKLAGAVHFANVLITANR